LWNPETYDAIVTAVQNGEPISETFSLRGKCVLNDLSTFHATTSFAPDLMHDFLGMHFHVDLCTIIILQYRYPTSFLCRAELFLPYWYRYPTLLRSKELMVCNAEGVVAYDLLGALKILRRCGFISVEEYNEKLSNFKRHAYEQREQPVPLKLDMKQERLSGNAMSIMVHLR
jgi:hypothetical protein